MDIKFFKDGKVVETASGIDLNKPAVFIFSGANVNDEESAAKLIKDTKTIMRENDLNEREVDFYPAFYLEPIFGKTTAFNTGYYDDGRPNDSSYSKKAASMVLFPRVEENGKRFSVKKAGDLMENVVMQGMCVGGAIIYEMGDALYERMKEVGYNDNEIKEITSKAKVMITNSGAEYKRTKASFSSYWYFNLADKVIGNEIEGSSKQKMKELSGLDENSKDKEFKSIKVSDNEQVLITNKLEMPTDEQIGEFVEQGLGYADSKEKFNEVKTEYQKCHYFRCTMRPIHLQQSKYMQNLRGQLVKMFGEAIGDTIERHKRKKQYKNQEGVNEAEGGRG